MEGYELTFDQFKYLIKAVTRKHAKKIAGLLSCTAHTRNGLFYFRDHNGKEIPLSDIHNICQSNAEAQQSVYNLFMNYAR